MENQLKRIDDFRPIPGVGCVHKIISNVLENRLYSSKLLIVYNLHFQRKRVAWQHPCSKWVVDECKRKKKSVVIVKVDY